MRIGLGLLQIILLVLWFAVPGMAAVPTWLVFLPLIIIGVLLAFALVVFIIGLCAALRKPDPLDYLNDRWRR